MSWLWGSSQKGQKDQKDQKDSVSSVARASPRAEVGSSKEKLSGSDFVPSLGSKASDTSSSERQADEKKKLPTFKTEKKLDSKKPTFNLDTKTDRKSLSQQAESKLTFSSERKSAGIESETKLTFSSSRAATSGATNSRSPGLVSPKKSIFSSSLDTKEEKTTSAGRGFLDDKPTSIASSRSESENKFSFKIEKEPSKPTSTSESKKFPSFGSEKRAETSSSGVFRSGFLDEKAPSREPAGGLDKFRKPEKPIDTWSTITPSSSVANLDGADQKVMEDEERLFKWDQAIQQVDMQQSEILTFQSKLQREQVHALTADGIQMRNDITELFQRCDLEVTQRTESIEVLKQALAEMEDRMLEEIKKVQSSITAIMETEKAELSTKAAAEEKIRKSEFNSLEEKVQRLKHELQEPDGKTKEPTVNIATRLRDAEDSIDQLFLSIENMAKAPNNDSQQSLDEKIAKLQKLLADAASKSELGEVKKELERETQQRTKGQQTLEEKLLTKSEFKSLWKVEFDREGKNMAKADDISSLRSDLKDKLQTRSIEPAVGKDVLVKLRSEFDEKLKEIQTSLVVVKETRSSVSPLQEALQNEIKARVAFQEESNKIFAGLREEMKRMIEANRAEIEANRSSLRKFPLDVLAKRIDDVQDLIENERKDRASQDVLHDEQIRDLADGLSKEHMQANKEMQRLLSSNKEALEQEQRAHAEDTNRLVELMNGKLEEERSKRKQAIAKVEEHLASHTSQIGDSNALNVDKHEDTLKRLNAHSKEFEGVKRAHQDELEKLRKRQESSHKDLEKGLAAREAEHAKIAANVKQLGEKLENYSKEHKDMIGEVHEKVKSQSQVSSKAHAEHSARLDQAARSREDEVKKRQKADEEVARQMQKLQTEAQKNLELHINQNTKRVESLDIRLSGEIKKHTDEQAALKKEMKDMVKNVESIQNDKLGKVKEDISTKISGIKEDTHNKVTALSREVDTKVEKANSQQLKTIAGVTKDLTAQLQDLITVERRLRDKGLKEVSDRIDNAELRRR